MITLENVVKVFQVSDEVTVDAVAGVSLSVTKGEFIVLSGRSGSGKTTLLNLAAGLIRPTSGCIFWEGKDLWAMTEKDRSRLRNQNVGFIFQFPSLLPSLTVYENVVLPTSFERKNGGDSARARAEELLLSLDLVDKLSSLPRQLSAGQQQRVVIARALMNYPKVLFADEPTSNLDERTECEIIDLFQEIHASLGLTIIMVTHTSNLLRYGTRSITMSDGVCTQPKHGFNKVP